MATTKLEKVWNSTTDMWGIGTTSITSNISMNALANVTGFNASIPNLLEPPMGVGDSNISLEGFSGLYINSNNSDTGFQRFMKTGADSGDICNSFLIIQATTYVIRSFQASTTIYKNNSSLGNISAARGTLSPATAFAVGDRISANKPFTIYRSTIPGTQGSYAGYAGFSFATRRDRYTKTFRIFNLSPVTCTYQIMYTSATGAVNSMTSVSTGTISANSFATYTTSTTGQYFILCDQLCCAFQGQVTNTSAADTIMLYPLSSDNKYGWFSSNGHSFAVENNQINRTNSGGGNTITALASNGSSLSTMQTNGGRGDTFSAASQSALITGGSYFSGNATVLYNASTTEPSLKSTMFTAESQADGNGGEATSFTSQKAHARATVTGGGSAWNAFVSAGFSGSTPTYPLFADVIMRFNSSGVFQEAKSFVGTTTSPRISKSYFGNGSGTGASASPGDFFLGSCLLQGYQDTDSSDKDESNMIMSNDIDLPEPTTFTIGMIDIDSNEGWESCEDACGARSFQTTTKYSPSTGVANGMVLFSNTNATFNLPWNGQNYRYLLIDGRTNYCIEVGFNGIVKSLTAC